MTVPDRALRATPRERERTKLIDRSLYPFCVPALQAIAFNDLFIFPLMGPIVTELFKRKVMILNLNPSILVYKNFIQFIAFEISFNGSF